MSRSYSELIKLKTFEERFEYLHNKAKIGEETFGHKRFRNQRFYSTTEWKNFRRKVILRDGGCDLGIPDREIVGRIVIHHINPLTPDEVARGAESLMDMENVICVSYNTHEAIHFGDSSLLQSDPIIRRPNDTCPWKS